MQLISGPAASGKTAFVVERFSQALRRSESGIRLLVPTATLARHLQNRIAREGLVLRPNLIQTLSAFVDSWGGDRPQVPDSVLYILVEEAVAQADRAEFRRVGRLPGFCASLARTISEFSSAGCDSARLAKALPEAPLAAGFLAVYREVERLLERRGLALRAKRLECAAARIRVEGLGGIREVWLDGFHALPDPELGVIEAIGKHAELTLTLSDGPASRNLLARLERIGFAEQRLTTMRPAAPLALVRARNIEREVDEIARRIVALAAEGRPFREIGIVVRAADTYVPVLRSVLSRFGIPARFYFDPELEQHAATRFLSGAVDAMLGGWEHSATLAVLRLAPRFADSATMDRLDFAVREQLPNSGLGTLRALVDEGQSVRKLIDELAALEEWRAFEMPPAEWRARFGRLRNLFRPARRENLDHETALELRAEATALQHFDEALQEAAQALDATRPTDITQFWRAVKSVLRLKPLRLEDGRRSVVHVLSAHEARQWVLPIVFVCGLTEKQFPQFHPQDPFFPDAARCQLNGSGIRVRTAADFETEERALFESALTRASDAVTLSYPEFDARGNHNLPSIFLEGLGLEPEEARAARPQPSHRPAPPQMEIRSPRLLEQLRQRTAEISPSALEAYLQCPFQYFGGRLLRLKTAPVRPEDRLDFLTQGEIVHAVLAEWYPQPRPIAPLFERHFAECLEKKRIPGGYHTERLRNSMLEDLERFAADTTWPRDGFQSQSEQKFLFPITDNLQLKGRIDRLDFDSRGRAYVLDYKYSAAQRLKEKKNGDQLQGPLYMMAAEKAFGIQPAGMFFVSLKGGVEYAGWSEPPFAGGDPIPERWLEDAAERTFRIVEAIRDGRIAPRPHEESKCRYCDSRDVCRIEVAKAAAVAEGA